MKAEELKKMLEDAFDAGMEFNSAIEHNQNKSIFDDEIEEIDFDEWYRSIEFK